MVKDLFVFFVLTKNRHEIDACLTSFLGIALFDRPIISRYNRFLH